MSFLKTTREAAMHLYFFRHAVAQPADDHTPDHKRALTPEGIARTHQAARQLKTLGVDPDRLYSSPLIRARQTADIIGQTLGIAVQVRKEVGPGFNLSAVEALTRDLGDDDEALFVGHEPDFSQTIAALVGGRVVMKKGGLARIDSLAYHPLVGQLVWLITPKTFEQMR
jgi:phosphohistidine phosphatase